MVKIIKVQPNKTEQNEENMKKKNSEKNIKSIIKQIFDSYHMHMLRTKKKKNTSSSYKGMSF